jgi:hypothetical protein
MDEKMKKYLIILGVIIFLVIILSFLSNTITGGSKYSFESLEKKLVEAAKKYTKDLPGVVDGITPNTSVPVSSDVFVSKGNISDLSEIYNDDVNCVGSVEIFKTIDNNVNDVPYLTGGKNKTV